MDTKDLKGLMEAYSEVYAPQEVDEAVKGESSERRKALAAERRAGHRPKSAKEGEAYASHKLSQMAYVNRQRMGEEVEEVGEEMKPLPKEKMARQAQKAYGKEVRAAAAGDEKETNKQMQRRNAMQMPASRRTALQNKKMSEELDIFDVVLEFLQVEGYAETLEEAEWMMANVIDEEAIDIILGEEQLDEISLKTKMKAYAATQDPEADYYYGRKVHAQGDRLRAAIVKKHGEKAGEHADAHADASHWGRKDASGKKKGFAQSRTNNPNKYRTRADGKMHGQDQNKLKAKLKRRMGIGEEYMDEASVANRDPDKYEREQAKKSAPVRGERTPMPPRGDKRREDFEKWYAANVR